MATPYLPTAFATPIVNPAVGSSGAPPIPYISNAEFLFAPTAMTGSKLVPGGTSVKNAQSLADTIRRASSWADEICFGADAASKGASIAASLSVGSQWCRVVNGEARLFCDYRPIIQVVGVDIGPNPAQVQSIGATLAARSRIGRLTITVPLAAGYVNRTGNEPAFVPSRGGAGRLYAAWSYVNGYAHTRLAESVTEGATECVVTATDGNGGLWGVFPASGAFPGTSLLVTDGQSTEAVYVKAVTAGTGTTKLTTSAFANAHTVPGSPDFIPVSAVPDAVHQAVISLTTVLIKVRGARAFVMPQAPGGRPSAQAMGQAGVLGDYELACKLLHDYGVRQKMAKN